MKPIVRQELQINDVVTDYRFNDHWQLLDFEITKKGNKRWKCVCLKAGTSIYSVGQETTWFFSEPVWSYV